MAAPIPPRALILGGTGEAAEIAARLEAETGLIPISSLAGRVAQPRIPTGLVRTGGFGGVPGLIAYLTGYQIATVIDATHPFAARIGRNAEQACQHLGLPLLALSRPPWLPIAGDRWLHFADIPSAAAFVATNDHNVLLTIGRQELAPFAACLHSRFLIRSIDPPDAPLPPRSTLLLDRGPFTVEQEVQLLRDHAIQCIVSKNSGGPATYAKIEAARTLGLPVVMVARPAKHTGPTIPTIDELFAQLRATTEHPR